MPTFQAAPESVRETLNNLLFDYADKFPRFDDGPGMYQEIIDQKVRIDILMAFGDRNPDSGEKVGDAITHQGRKALGLFKLRNTELRASGLGDCCIILDGDWWQGTNERRQRALLDHELFHLDFKRDKAGNPDRDDLNRPKLRCRPHTFEVGWFGPIAIRHGLDSMEIVQAREAFEEYGKYFWPGLQGEFRAITGNAEEDFANSDTDGHQAK